MTEHLIVERFLNLQHLWKLHALIQSVAMSIQHIIDGSPVELYCSSHCCCLFVVPVSLKQDFTHQ